MDCIKKDNCTHYALSDETVKTITYQLIHEFENDDWVVFIYDKWYAGVTEDMKDDWVLLHSPSWDT